MVPKSAISARRIKLLRACYLLLFVGLVVVVWPQILTKATELPFDKGITNSLLGSVALLAVVGLVYPVHMLPLLVFEVLWKSIWVISVAVPSWQEDSLDPEMVEALFACAFAVPFLFIIPWRSIPYLLRDSR